MEKKESKSTDENVSEDKSKESPSEMVNQTDLKEVSNQEPEKKSPEDIILELYLVCTLNLSLKHIPLSLLVVWEVMQHL